MLEVLNQKPQKSNNLIDMLSKADNPQQLISNLIQNNPQITTLINQYGNGDPKAAFYEYARRNGQDPEQILNLIKRLV